MPPLPPPPPKKKKKYIYIYIYLFQGFESLFTYSSSLSLVVGNMRLRVVGADRGGGGGATHKAGKGGMAQNPLPCKTPCIPKPLNPTNP